LIWENDALIIINKEKREMPDKKNKKTAGKIEKTVKQQKTKKTVGPKTKYHSVTMEELLEATAHLGHLSRKWNPKMKKFIWQDKSGVHIIDLEQTVLLLDEACKMLEEEAARNKRIVIVGTKRQAKDVIKEVALKYEIGYVTGRWLGGLVTNWKQMKSRIDYLYKLKEEEEKGEWAHYTKKERLLKSREISKLERMLEGIDKFKNCPEILVIVDTQKEKTAIREGKIAELTVVGLTDTNADPNVVEYPIPINDDSHEAIRLVIEALGEAIGRGKKKIVN